VSALDPLQGIGGVSLVSNEFISGNQFFPSGEARPPFPILSSAIFGDDPAVRVASLAIGDRDADWEFDRLDAHESAVFAPQRSVHVEFEAVLEASFQLSSIIHEFELVPIPEPATLPLAGLGLAALAALSRSGARARRSGRGAGAAPSAATAGGRRPRA
jgi:PEP-CTERM motif